MHVGIYALVAVVVVALGWPYVYVFVMRYVFIPLRGRGETTLIEPPFIPFDPSAPGTPRDLIDAARHLPLTNAWASVWRNAADATGAQVLFVRSDHPSDVRTEDASVTFETDFTDDSAIVTTNLTTPSLFPPDPAVASVRWRGMRDVATLYRLHLARVERSRGRRTTKLFHDPMQYFLDGNRRAMEGAVARRYYVRDADDGVYRKTLKGCVLTYRLLWPWQDVITSRYDRELRAELAACGMGRPEEYATQPPGFAQDPTLDYDGSVTPQ